MKIEAFYDPQTYTVTYIVFDSESKDAVIIDPVLDYEPWASQISFENLEKYKAFIQTHALKLHYILETHAHADHLSSSQYLKEAYPTAKIGIGENIKKVQEVFKGLFNFKDLKTDGSQFDQLFCEGEVISAGSLEFKVINTPGHTPACVSFLIDDAVFTGDSLFLEDYGTGRCDFPGGNSADMYVSIHDKLYHLPDDTRVFVGHDYQPGGREVKYESTIGISKEKNPFLQAETSADDFITRRNSRDSSLKAPVLLLPSVQVNINAGAFPAPEDNGLSYLKIPLR
ncbi:MAG: MBL fold metallo-hydrolase [Candidatus Sericytochromatia bacterium]|nr:MBL fold metallo-hydrolase [Candidatus Sericytochromatia bacterium]